MRRYSQYPPFTEEASQRGQAPGHTARIHRRPTGHQSPALKPLRESARQLGRPLCFSDLSFLTCKIGFPASALPPSQGYCRAPRRWWPWRWNCFKVRSADWGLGSGPFWGPICCPRAPTSTGRLGSLEGWAQQGREVIASKALSAPVPCRVRA